MQLLRCMHGPLVGPLAAPTIDLSIPGKVRVAKHMHAWLQPLQPPQQILGADGFGLQAGHANEGG